MPAMTPTNDAESRARFYKWLPPNGWGLRSSDEIALVGWQARDAEVAAKDTRIAELEIEASNARADAELILKSRDQLRERYDALIAMHEQMRQELAAHERIAAESREAWSITNRQRREAVEQLAAREAQIVSIKRLAGELDGSAASAEFVASKAVGIARNEPLAALAAHTARVIEQCAKVCDFLRYVQADGFAKRYANNRDLAAVIRALDADQIAKEAGK